MNIMCNYNSKLGIHTNTHKRSKKNNDKNINMERVCKNGSDFRMCLNSSKHQLKIDCYKHSLVNMKYIITTNKNLQEICRK